MHFLCKCGYGIHDSSDGLSYKGWIIADQDWDEFCHLTDRKAELRCSENADMHEADAIDSRLYAITERAMYQCPACGRVYIENLLDNMDKKQADKIKGILNDEEKTRQLMNNPQVQALIRKLTGDN